MSNKLVRATARALVAGFLVAATVVLGAGTSSADTAPPPPPPNSGLQNGNQSNGNSWIHG